MNLKEMIQEAVKEALKEKGTVVATAKSKDKSSKDVQPLDATRGMGPHLQDPRCNPDQWPCYNQHVPWTSSNRVACIMWRVDRLSKVRGAPQVHSPQGCIRAIYEDGSPSQCGGNPGASSDGRSQGRGHGPLPGEENSQTHRCPGSLESYQEDHSEVQGISNKREAAQAGDSAREYPDPLRRRGGNSVLNGGGIHSHREEEVQELNYGLKAPEPQILEGPTYESEEPEHEEHHDPTPKEVLSRLSESLKDSVFHIEQQLHALQRHTLTLWEICCSTTSTLTAEAHRHGFKAKRWNYESGFDLEKPECVKTAMDAIPHERPSKLWGSLRCTPWTATHRINQRTPQQIANLRRMGLRSRKQVRHVLQIFRAALLSDPSADIYFEWPSGAKDGWSLQELKEFESWCIQTLHRPLYFTRIDGCMVGLTDEHSVPIHKPWTIMTTDQHFHVHAAVLCDGSHCHRQVLGMGTKAVASAGFYPRKLAQRIVQVWKKEAYSQGQPQVLQSLHTFETVQDLKPDEADRDLRTLETFLPVQQKRTHSEMKTTDTTMEDDEEHICSERKSPIMFDIPTEEREKGRAILHRLHRSAGHPSNRSLARLIRDRKLPSWLVDEALRLQCPHCVATQPGNQMILHRSIGEHPRPWQLVGMDVFELPFPEQQVKTRFLLMTCLTMNFVAVSPLESTSMSATGTDAGAKLVDAFCHTWLAHRPRPEWVVVDSQTSLTKGDFPMFLHTTGIGLLAAPGEGHWIHGKTEGMVKTLKRTMRRIRHEHPLLSPSLNASLAVFANNHTVRSTGFSPVQWAYGYDPDELERANDPLQANAEKAFAPKYFQEFQRMRQRATELFRQESARESVTRLWNSAPRAHVDYKVGDFVCIWRTMTLKAKKKTSNYNPEARFFGPGRIVLIEPTVLEDRREAIIWVLCGTTLYRCAREQLRPATEQETLVEVLRSGEILSRPRTDLLNQLKSFVNVAKEPIKPDDPEYQDRERERSRDRGDTVASLRTKWNRLVSVNENRRREGLPPLMQLPAHANRPEVFHLDEQDPVSTVFSPGVISAEKVCENILHLDLDTQILVLEKIKQIEAEIQYQHETQQIRKQIEQERQDEQHLLAFVHSNFKKRQEDRQWVHQVGFDITDDIVTSGNPFMYVKRILESKNTEVSYRQLTPEDIPLFDEAKAKEVAEVLGSLALRAIQTEEERQDAISHPERHLPMRWVLTWKPVIPPEPPERGKPTTLVKDGSKKAKARVVLLGFRHPDLIKRHPITGQPELRTAAPTISRIGRNLLLQCFCF